MAFKTGYILSPRSDAVWFLGLPFAAVLIALGFQAWLPYIAVASLNLWITIPHHYATFVRSYGMPEVWERFRERLILGPILLLILAIAGLTSAPITMLLLVSAWDHQHSVMQQHGFGRIYDFKAKTGLPSTRRYDLGLHLVLYIHMFLNAPLFRHLWIRELYRLEIPISVGFVEGLMTTSGIVLVGYLLVYAWHLRRTVQSGEAINPIKYAFIGASYFLWYFAAWNTNSILIYAVAHRIMHGLQYLVIVFSFMQKAGEPASGPQGWGRILAGHGRLQWFIVGGIAYAMVFQLLLNRPLDEFGFGVVNFAPYPPVPQFNFPAMDYAGSFALWGTIVAYLSGLMHYYVDSFIWKVRDEQVQGGL